MQQIEKFRRRRELAAFEGRKHALHFLANALDPRRVHGPRRAL
jgi:hypothetical protein